MSKNLGTVRSISYHEESREAWGLKKPIRQDEGTVVVEIVFSGAEVLQDIRVGDTLRIGDEG